MAEALLRQHLGNAILSHPGLMAVPKAVRGQPVFDGAARQQSAGAMVSAFMLMPGHIP
jgi:hypothetical protein